MNHAPAVARAPTSATTPRWLIVYFALAAINVIAVGAAIGLGEHLMRAYAETFDGNIQAAELRDRFIRLDQLAADVDAPGNEVFSSHDPDAERRVLDSTFAVYRAASLGARAPVNKERAVLRDKLLRKLADADTAMDGVVAEGHQVVALYAGDPQGAALRMALMDRHYANVHSALREAVNSVGNDQHNRFSGQFATTARFRALENAIGLGTLFAVLALLYYGRRLSIELEARVVARTAELEASEERFRLVSQATNDVLWDWDLQSGIVWHSDALRSVLGWEPEAGHTDEWWLERVHPGDLVRFRSVLHDTFHGDDSSYEVEYRMRRKGGDYAVIVDRGFVVRSPDGTPIRALGSFIDVSERRRTQAALTSQHAFLRQVIDTIPNFVFVKDRSGRFTLANRAVAEAYGTTPDGLVGRADAEFTASASEIAHFRKDDLRVMDSQVELTVPEELITDASGAQRWLQTIKRPIMEADGVSNHVLGVSTDITTRKQAKEALEQLAAIVAASDDAIVSIDREGTVQSWNQGAEELLGYRGAEVIGRPLATVIGPTDSDNLATRIRELLRDASVQRRETVLRRRDGTRVDVALTVSPLRGDRGTITGYAIIASDVTERKAAEATIRHTAAVLADAQRIAHVGSWERDLRTGESYWSDEIYRQLGLEPQSVPADFGLFLSIVHPEDRVNVRRSVEEAVTTGQPFGFFMRFVHTDGSTRVHEARGRVEWDASGAPLRMVGTSLDVDSQKSIEAELTASRESAEAGSRAKSDFLANMSHEIRTPMNGVLGMLELTLDSPLTVEQRDYILAAHSSAEALLDIINDILDFSKIEAGRFELDDAPFELGEDLGDAMAALAIRAHEKGLELGMDIAPDVPDILIGDMGRLRQVIVNLIGNAIKFTTRGEVALRIAIESRAEDSVVLHFAVSDNGIGIAPDKKRIIFEAFQQADTSTTREYGGTGLGLAISSRIVNLMGGAITLDSEPNVGSTFSFTSRFGLPSDASAHPHHVSRLDLADVPVLVVDDSETNVRIVVQMLERAGMRTLTARDGRQALALLEEASSRDSAPPLVVTDVDMPNLDGFGLLSELQMRPELAHGIVLMLSSARGGEELARCRALGFEHYLLKPVRRTRLLSAVRASLASGNTSMPRVLTPSLVALTAVPPHAHGRQILLAEDNLVNQKLALGLLSRAGHSVDVVASGRDAIAAVRRKAYDVVLMDVQMPELGGLEATRLIREYEGDNGRRVPIIALTARAMKGDREECLAAGMDDYVSKPVRSEELLRAIDSVTTAPDLECTPPMSAPRSCLDQATLTRTVDGDMTLLRELVELFVEDYPTRVAALRHALRSRDARALRFAAHAIKGAAGSMAAHSAASLAEHIEQLGHQETFAGVEQLIDELDQALRRAHEFLVAL